MRKYLIMVFLLLLAVTARAQFSGNEIINTQAQRTSVRWSSGIATIDAGDKIAVGVLNPNGSVQRMKTYTVPAGKVLKVKAMFFGTLEDE